MKKVFTILAVVAILFGGWRYSIEVEKVLSSEPTSWTQDHKADCAVVLTGGAGRVREGFDLLAQKQIKKLIISGVFPQARLREIFPQWPFYGGLKKEDVILEKRSRTTYGNAQQTLPLVVDALHCKEVILVTSQLHMYRSMKIFKKIYPTEITIYPRATVAGSFKPRTMDVINEVTKSIFYSIWAY